ncbi:hypothetical protein [Histidinibacterium aquaticum]|uniref:DUF4365 domain-containing protein n=1 Tax=Histidinibacterium aquaticum TaxID=2613962 RepID=A0A5J5GKP5_9RHOB|nr:hypothetical protein [Histidinibacterium aquaticum]KAA9008896.1 hypothetical protein F3S47_06435 [Histidinibacterium aquaticum]
MTGQDLREAHSRQSVLREIILEHGFIADLLRLCWRRGVHDVEILRSEFDAGGYDLVVSRGDVTRHLQLKAKHVDGRRSSFAVGLRLAARPAGGVLCLVVTDDLEIDHYRWFGNGPDVPLPDITGMKVARHTKGDAEGTKAERPDHRLVPLSHFDKLRTIEEVAETLLGPLPSSGR